MKKKNNEGFSLTEVLVAMAILTAIVIPVCSSLVLCSKLDARAEATLRARIAVSSAVERLSAAGITGASGSYDVVQGNDEYPDVKVSTTQGTDAAYYNVVVQDNQGLVTVTTCIRAAAPAEDNGAGGGNSQ